MLVNSTSYGSPADLYITGHVGIASLVALIKYSSHIRALFLEYHTDLLHHALCTYRESLFNHDVVHEIFLSKNCQSELDQEEAEHKADLFSVGQLRLDVSDFRQWLMGKDPVEKLENIDRW